MENTQNLSNEYDIRKEKINTLQNNGEIVYKERFDRTNTIKQARELGDGVKVRIAGRIIFRRVMGKFGFMQIRDLEAKIQVSVGINELNQRQFYCCHAKDNPTSGKVMTKVGFRYQSDGVYSSWNQERKFESKEYLLIVE